MTLKEADIPFALGGSYACWARGGPEPVHDVDFMLREEDVARAVSVLAAAGLRSVDPPEDWLTKVFDGEVLVDLIHHPVGRAVTGEMLERSSEMSVDSVRMPVLDATDWFEMTLLALEERYCDLARVLPMIRAMREQVDWDQVRRATAASPFAEAALLVATRLSLIPPGDGLASTPPGRNGANRKAGRIAATGTGVSPHSPAPTSPPGTAEPAIVAGRADTAADGGVPGADSRPEERVATAGRSVAGQPSAGAPGSGSGSAGSGAGASQAARRAVDPAEADEYLAGDLHELLAEDPRVAELGLEVAVREGYVLVEGEVATDARRRAVAQVIAEAAPGHPVRNDVTITGRTTADGPANVETIQ
ncbi:BON domain-containing protein [Frankia sp. AgB32]|uniref:BON domain-containing protein n=1 Tax=Frankia sp. AgB32 TaxID=631119 RepID=UPI0027E29968|nr:BON domain-containing protein [Frankia sp. AgB32]